jgi:hypothetical protein
MVLAQNGVIVITTKSGKRSKGLSFNFLFFMSEALRLPEIQGVWRKYP